MQQWEYFWTTAFRAEFDDENEKGRRWLVFRSRGKKVKVWYAYYNNEPMILGDTLALMGADGWELVSTAVSEQIDVGGSHNNGWFAPEHLLFFKRPKQQ